MSTPHSLNQVDDESDTELSRLKARVQEIEQRRAVRSQATQSFTILTRRLQKVDKMPSHLCTDILSYRYSQSTQSNVNLKKDKVSILVFVLLARYLTKAQIEALATYAPTLQQASELLAKETEFPTTWFDCYQKWKKTSPQAALAYFTGKVSSDTSSSRKLTEIRSDKCDQSSRCNRNFRRRPSKHNAQIRNRGPGYRR